MKNQHKTPLFDALKSYHRDNIISFDVPGHKKNSLGLAEFSEVMGERILQMDANSMKQLDHLSNPTGVIKEAEQLMADAYGSDHSFFLVNGTTSGVQAMIMSAVKPGEKIILPRNAHKSAVNALILSAAIPVYIQPEISTELGISTGISVRKLEEAIAENPDAKAVFLMNPTYYGAISNLSKIINLSHRNGMAVLVDEAHGAHLPFSEELPKNSMKLGADMAAVSLHKTGGSLTQSSALLLNEGFIDYSSVKTVLNLTQTTSASYLLMGSLDVARKNLVVNGEKRFKEILVWLREARTRLNRIDGIYAFGSETIDNNGTFAFDETKLGINVNKTGLSGFEVYDILRDEYNIQVELSDPYNILAIVSVGDTRENIMTLVDAMVDLVAKYRRNAFTVKCIPLSNPKIIVSPRSAFYAEKKVVSLDEAVGEISGESIMAYPPGIPIVTPGEKITQEMIDYIKLLKEEHTTLTGTEDPGVDKIKVLGMN